MPLAPRLVGRAAEIAALDVEYRTAAAGAFRVVQLVAEPGMGKTRLAREMLARKRDRALGLSARGHSLGRTASFALWSEALDHHLRGLTAAEISRLCGGFTEDLATLLRAVAAANGRAPHEQPSRQRLLGGLAVLLSNLTKDRPVVVLLDDAHDADSSTWEALGYLARDLKDSRLLAIVAVRPIELSENPVGVEVLRQLDQDGFLSRLELRRLDPGKLGDLAREALDDEAPSQALLDWLEEKSRGNPLFALRLLEALRNEGCDLSAPELRAPPASLAGQVTALLRNLDERALAVLDYLSTFGRRAEHRDVAQLSGLPAPDLAAALERLVRYRLVVEDERGQDLGYEIAHPLIQEVIYLRIGAARRRGLHRDIARAHLASGRLSEAAPHFVRSAVAGDNEAIETLCDAVREAEAFAAYREALTLLEALVELIPPHDNRWLRVLGALAWGAEWVVDHRADTHALRGIAGMQAIDRLICDSPDPLPRGMVKFRLASFFGWGAGDLVAGEQACREALALFEQAGDRGSVLLARNELAWIRGLSGDYRAMEEQAAAVAADAEPADERLALIQGLQGQGFAAGFRGRFTHAETQNRRGNEIARAERKTYRFTVGVTNLTAVVLAPQGRCEEARAAVAEAKSLDPDWRDSILPEWEIAIHWFAGDIRTALACASDVAGRDAGELSKRRAFGIAFAILAACEAGDGAVARAHLARVQRAFGNRDWQFFPRACMHARGVLEWHEGRLAEACRTLAEAGEWLQSHGALPYAAIAFLDLTEAAADCGDADLAADAAQRLGAVAGGVDSAIYPALAALAGARRDLCAGSRPDLAAIRHAIDVLSRTDCRGFEARAYDVLGRSLVVHELPGAVEALSRAAAGFDAWGATWRRDRVRAALRALGAEGRKAAVAQMGPEALTRREREIARLAASGLMAAEIARRLSISERTVETHLANVYTKLGVRSKIELIRRAAEFTLNT